MEISIQRLWLLIKKQWVDHQKMYWLGMLAIPGVMASMFIIFISTVSSQTGLTTELQEALYFFGLIFFGALFTSNLLSHFSEKPKGIQTLILPASSLEKAIVVILYSNILFPLAYTMSFYPVLLVAHYIYVHIQGNLNTLYNLKDTSLWGLWFMFLIAQNIMLVCSIMFKQHAFVKGAILILLITYSFFTLNTVVAKIIVGSAQPKNEVVIPEFVFNKINRNYPRQEKKKEEIDFHYEFGGTMPFNRLTINALISRIPENSRIAHTHVSLPPWQMYLLNTVFYGSAVILLWLSIWFKLREKQV